MSRASASLTRRLVLVAALLSTTACFTDFERFKGVVPEEPEPEPEPDVVDPEPDPEPEPEPDVVEPEPEPEPEPDVVEPEPEPEPDVVEPEPDVPDEPVIGAACEADADCPEGLQCALEIDGGLCTVACEVDADCPDGAICGAENGFGQCLEACDGLNPCAREGMGEQALACRAWFDDGRQVCVSDDDEDRLLNRADNCVGLINADQRDVDQDGQGDVCDEAPQCPGPLVPNAPVAAVDRPSPPRALRGGAFAFVPRLRKAIYFGGLDEAGEPVSQVDAYDLDTRTWGQGGLPPLPYAASDLSVAFDSFRREIVATPGVSSPGVPTDRLLILDLESADWRLGPVLPRPLEGAQITYAFPHHIVITGYSRNDGAALEAYVLDRRSGDLESLEERFFVQEEQMGRLHAHSQIDGRTYVFSEGQRDQVYVVDPRERTFVRLDLGFSLFLDAERERLSLVSFNGASDQIYFARTDEGQVEKLFAVAGQIQATPYTLELPDQGEGVGGALTQSVYVAASASLLSVVTARGPELDAPFETVLVEHALQCFTTAELTVFDSDRDGAPDLVDNCARVRNDDQADLDGEAIGDACDGDIDGDEVPNAQDARVEGGQSVDLSLDTDNDGLPNAQDLDDDGDRIADIDDRYPLDSDDDRLPNAFDEDDDGDLFRDAQERDRGSDPTDVLSVPGGDRITFVARQGEQSSLVVTRPGVLANGGPLERVDIGARAPSWPRLVPESTMVIFADVSGLEPSAVVFDLEGVREVIEGPVPGLSPSGLDFRPAIGLDQLVVIRSGLDEIDGPDQTIELLEVGSLGGEALLTEVIFSGFGVALTGLDVADDADALIFSAGPEGCRVCADLSRMALPLGEALVQEDSDLGFGEIHPRLSDEGFDALFVAGPAGAARAWVLASRQEEPVAVSPEGLEVQSADFAPDARRIVISARPVGAPGAPFRLYLVDRALDRVWALTQGPVSAVDVSFAR